MKPHCCSGQWVLVIITLMRGYSEAQFHGERYGSPRATSFEYTVPAEGRSYFRDQQPHFEQFNSPSTPSYGDRNFYTPNEDINSDVYVSSQRPYHEKSAQPPVFITSTPQSPVDVTLLPEGFVSTPAPALAGNLDPSGFIGSRGQSDFDVDRRLNPTLFRPESTKRTQCGRKGYRSTRCPFSANSGRGLFIAESPFSEGNAQNLLIGQSPSFTYGPGYFNLLNGLTNNQCPARPQCRPSKYRNVDGSCNNIKNPLWGAAGTPYGRLLPAKYSDGVHAPPVSVTGHPLPGARTLSRVFMPPAEIEDPVWTLVAMQWGQIMTHDMSLAMDTLPNPRAPECCNPIAGPSFAISKGEPCYPIAVDNDDPLYHKYQQRCMEFLRTTTDLQRGCPSGKEAKPLSAVSHWLDGSTVYGSDDATLRSLREGQGGRLRVEVRQGSAWPPTDYNATITCARPAPNQICYKTGDVRVNQNPQLALLQIVLLREHNRIAESLQHVNPHWDDEILFQESKRILIGEIQHISYYEWLPIFLGSRAVLENGIIYKADGAYVNDYDDSVDPSVLNEHAQGAFRFFHTLIQGRLLLMSERRFSQGHLRLSEHLNDPSILEGGVFDDLTRGFATQAEHAADRFHTPEITENLFRRPENPAFGFDLKAVDIHRNRDHGLASYNDYREFCGFNRASTFQEFSDFIKPEVVQRLQSAYAHPDDVDLAVGATVEELERGTLAGPTFLCILREQFYRSRVADRYFFESGDHKGAFTPEQLTEIRKSNMARLLCDNSDQVTTMQPRAFEKLSKSNALVPCADLETIPIVNLEAWRDIPRGRTQLLYKK